MSVIAPLFRVPIYGSTHLALSLFLSGLRIVDLVRTRLAMITSVIGTRWYHPSQTEIVVLFKRPIRYILRMI